MYRNANSFNIGILPKDKFNLRKNLFLLKSIGGNKNKPIILISLKPANFNFFIKLK